VKKQKPKYTLTALRAAYREYGDSHEIPGDPNGLLLADQFMSVIPMEHSFESFSLKCLRDKKFYNLYAPKS